MRQALAALAFLTLSPLAARSAAEAALPATKPNILFVFSDDHSCQSIGAYRMWLSDFVRQHQLTPHIDRLAAQGAIFVSPT